MKKNKFSVIIILLLNPFFPRAQYFDWVQTYTGSDVSGYCNAIKSFVNDSDGNVYFLGCCAFDASIDGQRFLPMTPYGNGGLTRCTLIGKILKNGELEWSKIIHSNHDASHVGSGAINIFNDSLIHVCTPVWVPNTYPQEWPMAGRNYLYYMDTLMSYFYKGDSIVHNGNYLYDYARFNILSPITSYTTFDKSGNIKDEYWLLVSLLDTNGVPHKLPAIYGEEAMNMNQANGLLREGISCVDNDGNIIIVRSLSDYYFKYESLSKRSVNCYYNDPDISALRIYVNGKRYFDVPLPDVRPSAGRHNYQILKFSPHFEELLASQFLFEPTPELLDTISYKVVINALKCDSHNNIFLSGYSITDEPFIGSGDSVSLTIGGSDSLDLLFRCFDRSRGFLIKYDSALNPLYLKQLDRVTDDIPTSDDYYTEFLWPMEFDDTGNIVIFEGARALYDTVNTHYYYDSTDVTARSSVMLRIDPEDGRLISKGKEIKAEVVTAGGSSSADIVDFAAKNNRVIWQVKYRWWLDFAGERYEKAEATQWGMGFAVWDYDGNELCFVDYGTNGDASHATRSVCLVDSVLYLTGMLASGGAQFGDVTVYNSGSSQSFIARYVDTAFMHPYVHHGDLQDIQLVVRGGEPVATVYPNPCAQRVTVDWDGDEPPVAATVTDITGRTYSVALAAAGAGHSDSGAKTTGRYTIDFSSLPAANYLLTLTTPSGHRVTTRLLKR